MTALHVKYRPVQWDEVFGQDAAVKALSDELERGGSQVFLLSGPSGTGKTTLARIAANVLNASVTEIAAAVYTGVDDMRQIQSLANHKPLDAQSRVIILDEAHRLSGQAWDSLLKAVEEPPAGVYWFFCTTNPSKVPQTIVTRSVHLKLKDLSNDDLDAIVTGVCDAEGIPVTPEVLDVVIREARGSGRQMLVNLAACRTATTRAEAAAALKTALETDATLEFCQFLAKGGSWQKAMAILAKLEGTSPESVRIIVCNYMAAAARRATTTKDACHFLNILEQFSQPYISYENLAPLLLSVGRVILIPEGP